MDIILNSVGIILSVIGTLFTLWHIFIFNADFAGTWAEFGERRENAFKEKRNVKIGFVAIVLGAALQIFSQLV